MQVNIPMLGRSASWRPDTIDADKRTIELVWSTGAQVRRADWWSGKQYMEELSMDASAVRMDRLNSGANLLDSHASWSLRSVLGVVESARIQDGSGIAVVRFSNRSEVDPIWQDVQGGIIRSVSVGYMVHRYVKQESDSKMEIWRAVDWEPVELSLVAVPADAGAGTRSAALVAPCECVEPSGAVAETRTARNARLLALMERKQRRLTA